MSLTDSGLAADSNGVGGSDYIGIRGIDKPSDVLYDVDGKSVWGAGGVGGMTCTVGKGFYWDPLGSGPAVAAEGIGYLSFRSPLLGGAGRPDEAYSVARGRSNGNRSLGVGSLGRVVLSGPWGQDRADRCRGEFSAQVGVVESDAERLQLEADSTSAVRT